MEPWLSQLPWQGRLVAVVLASCVTVVAARAVWMAPRHDTLRVERQELEQRRLAIGDARRTAGRLPDLDREVDRLERRLRALRRALPEAPEAAVVLRELQALATESGLTLVAFSPRPAASQAQYVAWPVRLELTGRFHQLVRFLDAVTALPRIVTITDLSIQALDPAQPPATITVTCTAATYVLDDAPAGTATPEAGADGA